MIKKSDIAALIRQMDKDDETIEALRMNKKYEDALDLAFDSTMRTVLQVTNTIDPVKPNEFS